MSGTSSIPMSLRGNMVLRWAEKCPQHWKTYILSVLVFHWLSLAALISVLWFPSTPYHLFRRGCDCCFINYSCEIDFGLYLPSSLLCLLFKELFLCVERVDYHLIPSKTSLFIVLCYTLWRIFYSLRLRPTDLSAVQFVAFLKPSYRVLTSSGFSNGASVPLDSLRGCLLNHSSL